MHTVAASRYFRVVVQNSSGCGGDATVEEDGWCHGSSCPCSVWNPCARLPFVALQDSALFADYPKGVLVGARHDCHHMSSQAFVELGTMRRLGLAGPRDHQIRGAQRRRSQVLGRSPSNDSKEGNEGGTPSLYRGYRQRHSSADVPCSCLCSGRCALDEYSFVGPSDIIALTAPSGD